jgi:hypothetical protein
MFGWLRRKGQPLLEFADNQAAFAHACTIGYQLLIQALIPALVVKEGRCGSEGERFYRLHLAGPNGTLAIWGCTLAGAPGHPDVGELVAYRIVRIASELPDDASLIGYIACRLEPVLDVRKGWRIGRNYTPSTLKPELHL